MEIFYSVDLISCTYLILKKINLLLDKMEEK